MAAMKAGLNLRQREFGTLVDLCRKVCAVVREDYRNDAPLNEARLSMLKSIEDHVTLNDQIAEMDLGALTGRPRKPARLPKCSFAPKN